MVNRLLSVSKYNQSKIEDPERLIGLLCWIYRSLSFVSIAAWAAARRATDTPWGEELTCRNRTAWQKVAGLTT